MSIAKSLARAMAAGRERATVAVPRVNPLGMMLGDAAARIPMFDAPDSYVPMYGFFKPEDAEAYVVTTDELFGGRSRASMRVKEYRYFMAGVFEGEVDWTSDDRESRGGFCNVRTRERKPLRQDEEIMMGTEAVQLRVKTDGRPFLLNFQCSNSTDEDVWQAEVRTAPGRWETLALPWSGFAHVSRGLVRETQMDLQPHKIDGLGLTVADGSNGPFRCELQWVLALKQWDEARWGMARRAASAIMTETEAWARSSAGPASAKPKPRGVVGRVSGVIDGLNGPKAGQDADGRRVTPYAMTDEQRSRWRNARDRAGRRRIMDEYLRKEGKPGGGSE